MTENAEKAENLSRRHASRPTPILERNVRALIEHAAEQERMQSTADRIAVRISRFAGSMTFVYFHVVFFGLWVLGDIGWIPGIPRFDTSFTLLGTVASIEAIFLATFVLIAQNRMSEDAELRNHLDLQVSLLTEHEVTHVLRIVAWLALLASLVILALLLFASRKYWSREIVGGRLARLALAGSIGAILSVTLPNSLHWTSDSPYLDSARGVVDYTKGSGGGRVAQYRNSLKMAVSNPIFGVGPGNWPVRYVQYAPRSDRSITDDNTTANPWPSSDWVAFVSERGLIATLALLGVFGGLFLASIRKWKEAPDPDAVLLKIALAATITAAIIVGCFDAVLLLAAPSFLVWGILGAATGGSRSASAEGGRQLDLSSTKWSVIAAATMIVVALSVARSATETTAMTVIGYGGQTASWARGAAWDPGSYRINARVAELYANRDRCAKARPFAKQAARLFPSAVTPKRVLRRCG